MEITSKDRLLSLIDLTIAQYKSEKILIIYFSDLSNEIKSHLNSEKRATFLDLNGPNIDSAIRGLKPDIILIEGDGHNIPKRLFNETIYPLMGIIPAPYEYQKALEKLKQIPENWIKKIKIIYSDS